MKWITILWFGSIFIIYLLIIAATTVPKAEQRERREGRENVQLICPKSLEAAVGDDITLDFHLESGSDATKWKAFIFECKQNSDNALVYKNQTGGRSRNAEQSPIPIHTEPEPKKYPGRDSDIGIGYVCIAVFAALLEKYGTISTSSRRARRGRNGQTRKEKINIPTNLSPDNM
ncbi:hypothetical protein PFLUV_G00170000 [Perca fluviatilis]|uniref:Uncharacterized protein n=1 Tax=Perca fluviatilis TaxID=8168 RepID=A0A6A5DZQ5_PERFL|nr:hypothetical protein PFLUV_G00170000 [Perca fluviatilis]